MQILSLTLTSNPASADFTFGAMIRPRGCQNQTKWKHRKYRIFDRLLRLTLFSSPVSHRSRRPIHPLHVSIQAQTCTTCIFYLGFSKKHILSNSADMFLFCFVFCNISPNAPCWTGSYNNDFTGNDPSACSSVSAASRVSWLFSFCI